MHSDTQHMKPQVFYFKKKTSNLFFSLHWAAEGFYHVPLGNNKNQLSQPMFIALKNVK